MLGIHYMLCILRVHARDVYTLCTYPQGGNIRCILGMGRRPTLLM